MSDIVKLKKKDVISSKNPRIVEQKTGKTRILYLSSLQELIQDYTKDLKPEDYLFPSTKGGHLEVNTVYQMFQKVAALLDRDDIGTHTLRKTFGYHYYKKTKDVATLMEIFGHSSEKITKSTETLSFQGADRFLSRVFFDWIIRVCHKFYSN